MDDVTSSPPVVMVTAEEARARLAAAVLSIDIRPASENHVGSITLKSHQVEAAVRVRAAFREFGGALLCDPVGTGKTYVALSIAAHGSTCLVVAPAVLRDMWVSAGQSCGLAIEFHSFEALSRGEVTSTCSDLLLVDEAHHARNPATRRFASLARLASGRNTLLLSATPIHNRRRDLIALLSLFLGSRAEALTAAELGRCVLRRNSAADDVDSRMPLIEPVRWYDIGENHAVPDLILALPPPVPPCDGGDGGALIAHSLIRQWASSDAALEGGLRRRLHKAIALISALEDGVYPSRAELGAWVGADDSVQLGFSSLLASAFEQSAATLPAVEAHRQAVSELLRKVRSDRNSDDERASIIRHVRSEHLGMKIVAFSQYADTIDALFKRLVSDGGVAALTGARAKVAGGPISRAEVIGRFAPVASLRKPPHRSEAVSLLLTTDLLSEGVNLQDASVVVHLDLPWTAARMEQRLGRIARLGSTHDRVFAYAIRPPASAAEIVHIEEILRAKMRASGLITTEFPSLASPGFLLTEEPQSQPEVIERIRGVLTGWIREDSTAPRLGPVAALVDAREHGFVAACSIAGRVLVLGCRGGRVSEDPAFLLKCLEHCAGSDSKMRSDAIEETLRRIESHLAADVALGGLHTSANSPSDATRALLTRIAHIERCCRPHLRPRIAALAVQARRELTGSFGFYAEQELLRLAMIEAGDEEWLTRVGDFGNAIREERGVGQIDEPHDTGASVLAVILFSPALDAPNRDDYSRCKDLLLPAKKR